MKAPKRICPQPRGTKLLEVEVGLVNSLFVGPGVHPHSLQEGFKFTSFATTTRTGKHQLGNFFLV